MNGHRPGQWRAICDRCGGEYWSGQMRKEWTGLYTCHGPSTRECWEPRHPQEFLRGRPDPQRVPWTRPEPPDTFITSYEWDDDAKQWVEVS